MPYEGQSEPGNGEAADEIRHIIEQTEHTRLDHAGKLGDAHFYKVVLGGDLDTVQQIVAEMEERKMVATLKWLFQEEQHHFNGQKDASQQGRVQAKKIALFVILSFLNIVLTPVFYALHILSVSWFNRKQTRISEHIELPLAFAAFSQNPDMVAYFLAKGVDMDDTDPAGSNVFHYIADVSADNPEYGVKLFGDIAKLVHDPVILRALLMEQRNWSGMTPVEYTAKWGSLVLLTEMLRSQESTPISGKTSSGKRSCAKLELVDVSLYESGSITERSKLLNLLSDRDVPCMAKEELSVFCKRELIGKWTWLKTKQMMSGVLMFQVSDIVITCLMLVFVSSSFIGKFGRAFPQWHAEHDGKIILTEMVAWGSNESSFFRNEAFHRLVNNYRYIRQLELLEQFAAEDAQKSAILFNVTSQGAAPTLKRFLHASSGNWEVEFKHLSPSEVDALFDTAIHLDEFSDNKTALYFYRFYSTYLHELGHEILHTKHVLFREGVTFNRQQLVDFFNSFTFSVNGTVIQPCLVQKPLGFLEYVCLSSTLYNHTDFREVDHVKLPSEIKENIIDACYHRLVISVGNKEAGCKETSHEEMTSILHGMLTGANESLYSWCPPTLLVLTTLYLLVDLLERCVFVSTCIRYHTTMSAMVSTFLSQKVPGSYARKQLNMLSYVGILVQYLCIIYIAPSISSRETLGEYLEHANLGMIIFIFAIVIRFVMHIHSLRLLPGIGNFVITTFNMATNLLHFSTIFGCVLLIFSVLFYILIDNPECPVERHGDFNTLAASLMSTFRLTFGHGDLDPFVADATVQVTYVLYIAIMVLLLLNLIIAIMSTTAMELMAEPWKSTLWKVEWLDEATSVEYAFAVLTLPFKTVSLAGMHNHRQAGFIVEQMPNKKYRVFVELFHVEKLRL